MKLETARHPLYVISQLIVGILLLVLFAAYAYANYQWDDCAATTQTQLDLLQTRLAKNKERQDGLKARSAELAKKQKIGN
jgi:uncharacterized membrane-anchored protein YhcB (DUF1043 family)